MREGEVCGRRWRDWDRAAEPLGCLTVTTQYQDEPLKTDRPRKVPSVKAVYTDVERGSWADLPDAGVGICCKTRGPIQRFIEEYAKANQHKPSGITSKESVLRLYISPRFGTMRLDEITSSDVQKLKAELSSKKKSPKTVNNILSVLNKMLRVAVSWGVMLDMPVRSELLRSQDKEMTFYEPPVYEKLVAAAAGMSPADELLVRLGGDAGLRRDELLAIRAEHADVGRKTLTVSRNIVHGIEVDAKGLSSRRIPMTPELADLLQKHFSGRRGHLFRQDDGAPMSPKMLRGQMAKNEKAAGLDGAGRLHILRHTYCSHLAMAGVPVMEIQRFAGHANLTTTLKYMHLAPNADQQRAMAMLTKLRSGE